MEIKRWSLTPRQSDTKLHESYAPASGRLAAAIATRSAKCRLIFAGADRRKERARFI